MTVTLGICATPSTAGSSTGIPVLTIIDCHGVSGTTNLDPSEAEGSTDSEFVAGSDYTYLVVENFVDAKLQLFSPVKLGCDH